MSEDGGRGECKVMRVIIRLYSEDREDGDERGYKGQGVNDRWGCMW